MVRPIHVLNRLSVGGCIVGHQGAVALTVWSVLRETILNYVIFISLYRGQPIQQPKKWRNLGLSHVGPTPSLRFFKAIMAVYLFIMQHAPLFCLYGPSNTSVKKKLIVVVSYSAREDKDRSPVDPRLWTSEEHNTSGFGAKCRLRDFD